ncbi:MAG: prepilin-type N-terminal cleavage/methylation domain-containing protein [Candidatus Gastranaerophilales bacterium]|nr:prepilin-type N-terminal cleavage/methylation domain-containing protein [Candidatus Gastranaerophilales bacterium]
MKNDHTGFTLAEVLLTLLIIGVISSIVIPSIIQNTQKAEFRVMIKKEYGIAQSAYNLAAAENGGGFGAFAYGNTSSYTKFNAIKSKMNVIKSCDYGIGSFGNCWASGGVGKPGTATGCQSNVNSSTSQGNNASFVAADGSFWMLYSYSLTTGGDWGYIDVNGNKGPNDWGEDVFGFVMNDRTIDFTNSICSEVKRDGTVIADYRYLFK